MPLYLLLDHKCFSIGSLSNVGLFLARTHNLTRSGNIILVVFVHLFSISIIPISFFQNLNKLCNFLATNVNKFIIKTDNNVT
jgi:hypothetical protein